MSHEISAAHRIDYASFRVLIVEDHQLFAEAIRSTLEDIGMTILGVARSAKQVFAMAEEGDPNLVLLDLGLPDADGLDVGKEILTRFPAAKVLVLTASTDARTLTNALKAGFQGYVTKDAPLSKFVTSVLAVMRGQVVVPSRLSSAPTGTPSPEERDARLRAQQLTPREREVLRLLVEGISGSEIATRLSVSTNTVRTHVQNILTKLQVHSRLEAAAFAVRYGLTQPGKRTTDP